MPGPVKVRPHTRKRPVGRVRKCGKCKGTGRGLLGWDNCDVCHGTGWVRV